MGDVNNFYYMCGCKPTIDLNIGLDFSKEKPKGKTMDLKINDNEDFTATIKPVDSRGGPAVLDGPPVWSADDEGEFVTLTPSSDGLSCEVVTTGAETPEGQQVTITVEADAKIGEGTQTISDVINLTIGGSQAVGLGLATSVRPHA